MRCLDDVMCREISLDINKCIVNIFGFYGFIII